LAYDGIDPHGVAATHRELPALHLPRVNDEDDRDEEDVDRGDDPDRPPGAPDKPSVHGNPEGESCEGEGDIEADLDQNRDKSEGPLTSSRLHGHGCD
jgi:hypothetical protein